MNTSANFTTAGIKFYDPYPSKWQSVGTQGKSFEFGGCIEGDDNCTPLPPEEITEPGILALIGPALLAAGGARRRRSVTR